MIWWSMISNIALKIIVLSTVNSKSLYLSIIIQDTRHKNFISVSQTIEYNKIYIYTLNVKIKI